MYRFGGRRGRMLFVWTQTLRYRSAGANMVLSQCGRKHCVTAVRTQTLRYRSADANIASLQ